MSQADNLVQVTGDQEQRVGGGPKTFSSVLRNSHEYPEVEWGRTFTYIRKAAQDISMQQNETLTKELMEWYI
jgi:hypothetical protein